MSQPNPPSADALSRAELEARLSDLHYAILGELQMEGTKLGWNELVVSVPHLRDILNRKSPAGAPPLTSTGLQSEMRVMAMVGLVVRIQTLKGSTKGWQKTRYGDELLQRHKERSAEIRNDQLPTPENENDD